MTIFFLCGGVGDFRGYCFFFFFFFFFLGGGGGGVTSNCDNFYGLFFLNKQQ